MKGLENIGGDTAPRGFLPLVMGASIDNGNIKDSEYLVPTIAYEKLSIVFDTLRLYGVRGVARCAFFNLEPGGRVLSHIDNGRYYQKKDRFHLSIDGKYRYTCGKQVEIIEPGTLFWFDNKQIHSAVNIGDTDRITFVFDVPHEISPIRDKEGNLL